MSLHSLAQLPISLLALLSLAPLAHCDCYIASYGLVSKQSWIACSGSASPSDGVQTCCLSGSECGEDSICRAPDATGANEWYVAGCTDPNYEASVCNNVCGAYATVYIEYDDSSQDWMCCGNGGCNGTVTDDTFKAVSPEDWKVISGSSSASSVASTQTSIQSSPISTIPSATSSSSSIQTANSDAATTRTTNRPSKPTTGTYDFKPSQVRTSSNTGVAATSGADATSQSQNDSSGLSTGAQAGIGVGIGLAALALIVGLVAIFMLRRNRKSNETNTNSFADDVRMKTDSLPPYAQHSPYSSSDGNTISRVSELASDGPVYEIGGEENEVRSRSWRPW